MSGAITLHIDSLALPGLDRAEAARAARSFEAELTALLERDGLPPGTRAADLERIELRLRAGEAEGHEDAVKAARALRAATQNMLEERNRVDKLRRQVAGVVDGAGSLDLDAARDEIGRRLACLRRAGGGG